MKIVVLDGYAANPGDLRWDEFQALGECVIYDRTSPEQLMERASGAEVLLTNKTVITAENIDSLPALRYIGVLATGYNIVDIDAARRRNIVVTNIPAYSTDSVAQMVFAHLLNIAVHVGHHTEAVRQGRWVTAKDFCFWDTPLKELSGKRIGIIGFGNTGSRTARIALAFGMHVDVWTSKSALQLPPEIHKAETLDEIFFGCDIVSLHCPLTSDTYHLVDRRRLSVMKKTAVLINTARGPLVDEQALADSLNNEQLYAAGLDVLSSEPPRSDNPLLTARNCFITPHIAWASIEARQRLMRIAVNNLHSWIEGRTVNDVTQK